MKYTQILIIWFYLLSVLWGFAAPWHPSLITQSSSVPLLYYQVYLQFKVCTMQEAETGLGLCCWNHWRDSEEPKEMRNQRVKVALTPSHLWSSSILGPRCIPGGMRGMWPLSHGKPWNSRIIQVGTGLQDLRAQAVMISTPLAARRCHGAAHLFPWNFSLPSSQSCLSAGFHCQEPQHWNGKGDEVQWAVKPSSGCAQRTGNNSYHWSSCWLLLCSSWSFLSVLSLNHNLCAVLFRPLSCGCSTACSCLWGRWWWHPRQTAFCIFFQLVCAAIFSQYSFSCASLHPEHLKADEARAPACSQSLGKGSHRPRGVCVHSQSPGGFYFPLSPLSWLCTVPPGSPALPTLLHPALAWLVLHGFYCHLWGSSAPISTLSVSPLLWQLLVQPCNAAGTISLFSKRRSQHLPWAPSLLFVVIHIFPLFCTSSLFPTARFVPWALRWDWQLFYQILSPLASLQELLPFFSGSITTAITSLMISWIFHLLEIGTCELSS